MIGGSVIAIRAAGWGKRILGSRVGRIVIIAFCLFLAVKWYGHSSREHGKQEIRLEIAEQGVEILKEQLEKGEEVRKDSARRKVMADEKIDAIDEDVEDATTLPPTEDEVELDESAPSPDGGLSASFADRMRALQKAHSNPNPSTDPD